VGTWKSGKVRSWKGREVSVKPRSFKMTSSLWVKLLAGATFVATIWVPFYGYLHITALLSRYGFQSVSIDIDIYRFVLRFLSRVATGIVDINFSTMAAVFEKSWSALLIVSAGIGITVFLGVYFSDKRNTTDFSIESRIKSYIASVGLRRFALLSGILAFCLSLIAIPFVYFVIFIIFGVLFGLIILFGVAGYLSGLDLAVESYQKGYCFNDDIAICSQVRVNNYFVDAEVIYADNHRSYLITKGGLLTLNSNSEVVFKLPMKAVEKNFRTK
jgi:hypothetical protein